MLWEWLDYIDSGKLDWVLTIAFFAILIWALSSQVRQKREERRRSWALFRWIYGWSEEELNDCRAMAFKTNLLYALFALGSLVIVALACLLVYYLRYTRGWSLPATIAVAYSAAMAVAVASLILIVRRKKTE